MNLLELKMRNIIYSAMLGLLLGMPVLSFAEQAMSRDELDRRCEASVEKQLAPVREKKIEECKTDKTQDPKKCEQKFKDYGKGRWDKTSGYSPDMFRSTPECVEARQARSKTRQGTAPSTPRESATGTKQRDSSLKTVPKEATTNTKTRDSSTDSKNRDSTSGTSTR